MWAFVLALRHPLRERPDPGHRRAIRRSSSTCTSLPFVAVLDAARLPAAGRLPPAPRPLARGRLLRGAHRQHPRRGLRRRRRRSTSRPTTPPTQREGARRLRGVAARLGAVPRPQRHVHLRVARGRSRAARAALARRHRPQAHPDRRRRRPRPAWSPTACSSIASSGYQVVGFVDDRAGGDHIGYRGLPLLGTLAEVGRDRAARARRSPLRRAAARGARRSCST